MVTFLVCLVVVGGAIAAIVVLTIGDADDQPATEDAPTDRAGPLRNVGARAASYLVPSGPAAPSRPRTPAEVDGVPTEAEPQPVGAEPQPVGAEPQPAVGPLAGPVAASLSATPQDGQTLEITDDPAATMPVASVAAPARADDTVSVPVADLRAEAVADADATADFDLRAADPTMAMPVLQRTRVDDPARRADASMARSRSWRALRRLRGVALLVAMMVGLGTLLAVTFAGLVALVAIGVRAAVGT